jgi:hypothetical protein
VRTTGSLIKHDHGGYFGGLGRRDLFARSSGGLGALQLEHGRPLGHDEEVVGDGASERGLQLDVLAADQNADIGA